MIAQEIKIGGVIAENPKKGMKAINVDGTYITIFKNGISYAATTFKLKDSEMHRYGNSKVMHWNNVCVKSNTGAVSSKICLLEGLLEGHSVCKNCNGRTGFYHN